MESGAAVECLQTLVPWFPDFWLVQIIVYACKFRDEVNATGQFSFWLLCQCSWIIKNQFRDWLKCTDVSVHHPGTYICLPPSLLSQSASSCFVSGLLLLFAFCLLWNISALKDLATVLVLDTLPSISSSRRDSSWFQHPPSLLINLCPQMPHTGWYGIINIGFFYFFTPHSYLNQLAFALHRSGLASESAAWCVVCFSRRGVSPAPGLWTFVWEGIMRCVGFVRITNYQGKLLHKPPWNWVTLSALGENGVRMCVRERNRPGEWEHGQLYSL